EGHKPQIDRTRPVAAGYTCCARERLRDLCEAGIRREEFAIQQIQDPLRLGLECLRDLHGTKEPTPKLGTRAELVIRVPKRAKIKDGKVTPEALQVQPPR